MKYIICMAAFPMLAPLPNVTTPSPQEVEKNLLAHRRVIAKGAFQFRSSLTKDGKTFTKRRYYVWFDGNKHRIDIMPEVEKPGGLGKREVYCKIGENGKTVYFTEYNPDSGVTAVNVNPQLMKKQNFNVDPRIVGMYPMDFLNLGHYTLTSFYERPDRHNVTVEKATRGGRECLVIRANTVPSVRMSAWVFPDRGYCVGRVESELSVKEGKFIFTAESDLKEFKNSGIWFPSRCVFEEIANGVTRKHEELELLSISINEPLPTDCFSLAGMKVPAGKPIIGLPQQGHYEWDGKRSFLPIRPLSSHLW